MSDEARDAFQIGRAISMGWQAVQRQPGGLLLGAFLLALTDGGGGNGGKLSTEDLEGMGIHEASLMLTVQLVVLGCVVALTIGIWLFRSWLTPGYLRQQRAVFVDGSAPFTALFAGGDAFGRMALWKLLHGVILFGVIAVAMLPAGAAIGVPYLMDAMHPAYWAVGGALGIMGLVGVVYVGLGLALGDHAVALDGLAPVDALEKSWEIASGIRLRLFGYFFVLYLFTLAGLLVFCFGLFVTRAIVDAGVTEAYLRVTRDDADRWRIFDREPVLSSTPTSSGGSPASTPASPSP